MDFNIFNILQVNGPHFNIYYLYKEINRILRIHVEILKFIGSSDVTNNETVLNLLPIEEHVNTGSLVSRSLPLIFNLLSSQFADHYVPTT